MVYPPERVLLPITMGSGPGRPNSLGRMPLADRWRVWLVVALTSALILAPIVRRPPTDSFPLSTYPMFSFNRPRISASYSIVGLTDDAAVVRLSPRLVNGTVEVILAAAAVEEAIRAGGDAANELCGLAAARVADTDLPAVRLEVVTETYDTVAWFSGEEEPLVREVHASCEVPRP